MVCIVKECGNAVYSNYAWCKAAESNIKAEFILARAMARATVARKIDESAVRSSHLAGEPKMTKYSSIDSLSSTTVVEEKK
uniref:Uncharacterized protein n=1 Tax=Romanomermis culicivorax TaxID=13658 RepID=A0A915IG68_ROMCU